MDKKKVKCGGVALFNGILFTSDIRQTQIERREDNTLCATSHNMREDTRMISKIPIIRGIIGMKGQIGSAAPKFIESSGEEEKNAKFKTRVLYMLIILIGVLIPILTSIPFSLNARPIVQAIIIFAEFITYVLFTSLSAKLIPELNILFKYHGAEHMVVNTYEKYGKDNINLENVKKASRFHKRCGGNYLVYYVVLLMLFSLIPLNNLLFKMLLMLIYAMINIGIAFEVVNLFSSLPRPLDILNYPATLIQFATTKNPDEEMLKLAIYGISGAIRKENGITPNEYITKYVNEKLKKSNIEYDTHDIYIILEYITRVDINTLMMNKNQLLISLNQEIEADKLLDKYYFEMYPLQYITHKQFFYNEEYYVDESVLIPRSDSEILVEKAIEYINKDDKKINKVIDLCTGSGALGISIAKNSNVQSVELIDISKGALEVANRNISLNEVQNKVVTLHSDLLNVKISQSEEIEKVDMIVSNPPYIRTDVIASLDKIVQKEPHLALDGGKSGLDFYNKIISQAKYVLRYDGILILEIGYDQLEDLKSIINNNKEYKLLESVKDYGGNDRVIVCRFQGK